jgi:hypothetical protein
VTNRSAREGVLARAGLATEHERMVRKLLLGVGVGVGVLLATRTAEAANFEVVRQSLDAERHGYTVLRVWGTPYEMGFAQGAALAADVAAAVSEVKASRVDYADLRVAVAAANWSPAGLTDELSGLLAGVRSVVTTDLDVTDLEVLNTVGDWGHACRSHACWGSYVTPPVRMLATRRLDFGTPFPTALHHVVLARQPSDGSVRWVNLAWPGFVTVATAVNEHGVLVSLHDYQSTVTASPGVTSRGVASRVAVSTVPDLPRGDQLAWAGGELAKLRIATGTFVNFYAPEGAAGVFTCASGALCAGSPRTPAAAFHGGEVLVTTNAQTAGTTMPSGGEFLASYYDDASPKDLAGHFGIMGHTGLHLLSVAYRARGDMLLWAEGRQAAGTTPRIEIEWRELFALGGAPGAADAGVGEGGLGAAPGASEAAPRPSADGGCGCRFASGPDAGGGVWRLGAVALLSFLARRARRGASPRRGPRGA